ncbi:FAD-dependent monooxygenase [Nonomuraea sp. NPDC046802]|uniref:FAD-dependent monooxygenase n=1 Tax=Nonomuraea sp. NPDC046802 TaxID=3154919 RepID=UPI0033F477ED
MRILISGASVAGPVLAYWLTRHGFSVTVVERAPSLRKTGGHAVDLFRPAMNISEKMGVLLRVEERATGANRMTAYREGARRPVRVDLSKIFGATSDRHVEIMRDDLSEIYYDDVEYVFGDSIIAISPDGEVRFENARRDGSTSSLARTGCTPTCAASSSATSPASAPSSGPTSGC